MDYFDFFHPPFSSLATIVANGLSVNQILLRRSPPNHRGGMYLYVAGNRHGSHNVVKICFFFWNSKSGGVFVNHSNTQGVPGNACPKDRPALSRACPGYADTEGVGVTQYPLMHKQSGEVPWIQQADGGKLAHVTLSGSPDSAA